MPIIISRKKLTLFIKGPLCDIIPFEYKLASIFFFLMISNDCRSVAFWLHIRQPFLKNLWHYIVHSCQVFLENAESLTFRCIQLSTFSGCSVAFLGTQLLIFWRIRTIPGYTAAKFFRIIHSIPN